MRTRDEPNQNAPEFIASVLIESPIRRHRGYGTRSNGPAFAFRNPRPFDAHLYGVEGNWRSISRSMATMIPSSIAITATANIDCRMVIRGGRTAASWQMCCWQTTGQAQ
jgi:hypothetical protein